MRFFRTAKSRRSHSRRASLIAAAGGPVVEPLEGRVLLSGVPAAPHAYSNLMAYPAIEDFTPANAGSGGSASPSGVTNPTPIPGTLSPSQVQQAYGITNVLLPNGSAATGAGETIAIVDAYDDPNIQSDLHTFDQQYFGGVDPSFTK